MWLSLIRVGGYRAWSRGVAPKSLRRWSLTRCCKQKRERELGRRRSRRWSRRRRRRRGSRRGRRSEREKAREEEEMEEKEKEKGGNGEEGRR